MQQKFVSALRSTLLGLPSRFERLVFVASFQNPETRSQFSHLLPLDSDREELDSALRREHLRIFEEWLDLALEDKLADLEAYATGEGMADIAYQWLLRGRRDSLVPRNALLPQKQMYDSDAEILLGILDRRK